MSQANKASSFAALAGGSDRSSAPRAPPSVNKDDAAKRFVSSLKEYLVNADPTEPVAVLNECVSASKEHGHEAVMSAVNWCLEEKPSTVDAVVQAVSSGVKAGHLPRLCVSSGLLDSLEFLFDVAIDAPLAPSNASAVCLGLSKEGVFDLDDFAKVGDEFTGGVNKSKARAWCEDVGVGRGVIDRMFES